MAGTGAAVVYTIKKIKFFGRIVPVVLQNENGPCPLLGITNVLLLRNILKLPSGSQHISQDHLLALIAEHLLDSAQTNESGADASQTANQQQNVADAIAHLPKLTTGLDVNVRFDRGIHSFEFTDEVVVFDLLGISLVHGWLVDPQNEALKKAVDGRSYNELVCWLVPLIGQDSDMAQKLLTPAGSGISRDVLASVKSGGSASAHLPAGGTGDAEELAALEQALAMSLESGSAPESEEGTLDAMVFKLVSGVLSCVVSRAPDSECPQGDGSEGESLDALVSKLVGGVLNSVVSRDPRATPPTARASDDVSSLAGGSMAATAGGSTAALSDVASVSEISQPPQDGTTTDALEVALIQDFLDSSASQLTQHGITSLKDSLRPNELAVFFRNNHFCTIFNHEGALYLLVTDEGFLHESEVVWERLESVFGATTFCTSELKPFEPHREAASTAVALAQAAFASVVPAGSAQEEAVPQAGDMNCDADFALALQLQEQMQEEERQAQRGRQQQQQQQQQRRGEPQGQQARPARPPQGTQRQQQPPPGQQQRTHPPQQPPKRMEDHFKDAKEKCAIM